MKKKIYSLLLTALMIFSLLTGCVNNSYTKNKTEKETSTETVEETTEEATTEAVEAPQLSDEEKLKEQEAFNSYLDTLFEKEVTSSSLNMAFSLRNPEAYGISMSEVSIDTFSKDYFNDYKIECTENLKALKEYNYDALTSDQKYTYRVLENYLESDLDICENYIYYDPLTPESGMQNQLPILFGEYPVYNTDDIEILLTLLNQLPDYFVAIMDFEREKGKNSCFMSEYALDEIVSQCNSLATSDGYSFLIAELQEKVNSISTLTDAEKKDYSDKLKTAIELNFTKAYSYMAEELTAIAAEYGCNNTGLSVNDNSKAYYEALIESYTGAGKSVEELITITEEAISNTLLQVYSLSLVYPDLEELLENYSYPHEDDPEAALNYLIDAIADVFPEPVTTSFTLKNVSEAMEDLLSPAFYLIPPIDDLDNNIIYINNSKVGESMELFPTLAHEGFPGHLYQTTYFANTNPHPIRHMLNFSGYQEGWAKYVEIYSYNMAGINEGVASILALDQSYGFGLYSRIDMGIHYEGWDLNETTKYLAKNGITDTEVIEEIYYTLLADPGLYLQYYIGYLEIVDMRDYAYEALQDNFSLLEFHDFILTIGPSQFYLIRDELDKWIEKQQMQ